MELDLSRSLLLSRESLRKWSRLSLRQKLKFLVRASVVPTRRNHDVDARRSKAVHRIKRAACTGEAARTTTLPRGRDARRANSNPATAIGNSNGLRRSGWAGALTELRPLRLPSGRRGLPLERVEHSRNTTRLLGIARNR